MKKHNVLEEVKTRMNEMKNIKAVQLETIRRKQDEARAKIEEAAAEMKQATEELNVDGYEEAKNRKQKARVALEMYSGRYDQIKQQEYISEKDSDEVIDSLHQYEAELAEEFKAAAADPLRKLAEILKEYRAAVADTENTLSAWQRDIHANYNTRGAMTRTDPFTGQRTDRSEEPTPVHRFPFTGCDEAERMDAYLKKEAGILNR